MVRRFFWIFTLGALGLALSAAAPSPTEAPLHQLLIRSPQAPAIYRYLQARGHDLGHGPLDRRTVQVFTSNPQRLLKSLPFAVTQSKVIPAGPLRRGRRLLREGYFDAAKTVQFLRQLHQKYPASTQLTNLNRLFRLPPTADGNSLWALRVSPQSQLRSDRPKILIIGMHHARELMTHHAVMDSAADYLKMISKGHPLARRSLAAADVWFVPVVNPDGLNHVFAKERMWRKNRRDNGDGSFGVDLNRNYQFHWGKCGNHSSQPRSPVYRGPRAFSEVESVVMQKLNDKLKAQFVVSYHSSGNEVLFPYRCGQLGAEEEIYYDLRDRLAGHLGFGKRLASSSGEDFEHHYAWHGSLSFLVEIGTTFQPEFSVYRRTVWPKVKKILPFFLQELNQPFLALQVRDQSTGRPLSGVQVAVQERPLVEGERRLTDLAGIHRRRIAPGNYTVRVSYGQRKKLIKVKINKGGNVLQQIQL